MTFHDPQDVCRAVMLRGIHPMFLKPSLRRAAVSSSPMDMRSIGMMGAAKMAEKGTRRRAALAPRVMALHAQGMSMSAIARETGLGRDLVTRIVKEAA